MAVFENRQPVTDAKFINKSSLLILTFNVIRLPELKPKSNKKTRIYSLAGVLTGTIILEQNLDGSLVPGFKELKH